MAKSGLLAELRRRHVWRVAIAYAVAGWLLVQIATQVFPFFDIPNWTVRLVVVLIVVGFPVALALAWIYEITPEGIRRTESAGSPDARPEHEGRQIARRLNAFIIGVLAVAVVLLSGRLLLEHRRAPVAAAVATDRHAARPAADGAQQTDSLPNPAPVEGIPARSIAVLPFQNLSSDKENDYFVAGIQDLILTKLADISQLKVIARTSTAKYASQPENLAVVGQQLGVATVLEGSVQKQGNRVLINVQLIDTRTHAHLWAEAYTRTLTDVFGVEGEVAEQIATSLHAKLSPPESAALAAAPTTNQAAYDAFLRAEYLANRGVRDDMAGTGPADLKAAIPLYRQAVQADPKFALAWTRLSYVESMLAWFGGAGEDVGRLEAQARADADEALKLAPELPAVLLARGYVEYWGRRDYPAALETFATVLKLKPNDAEALAAQGYVQRHQGRFDAAIASLTHALAIDPRNSGLAFQLGLTYLGANRFGDAEQAIRRALVLDPHNLSAQSFYPSTVLYAGGDVSGALAAAQGDSPAAKMQRSLLLLYQRRYADALAVLEDVPDTRDNFPPEAGVSKANQQAGVYQLIGDTTTARNLYVQDLPKARAAIDTTQTVSDQARQWIRIAQDELGLGHTAEGLANLAKPQALNEGGTGRMASAVASTRLAIALAYSQARRADLAVPLLAKALAAPGIGVDYSPVLLWLDPAWDPTRDDPGFKALQKKYAQYKPAVIPAIAASAAALPSS